MQTIQQDCPLEGHAWSSTPTMSAWVLAAIYAHFKHARFTEACAAGILNRDGGGRKPVSVARELATLVQRDVVKLVEGTDIYQVMRKDVVTDFLAPYLQKTT